MIVEHRVNILICLRACGISADFPMSGTSREALSQVVGLGPDVYKIHLPGRKIQHCHASKRCLKTWRIESHLPTGRHPSKVAFRPPGRKGLMSSAHIS